MAGIALRIILSVFRYKTHTQAFTLIDLVTMCNRGLLHVRWASGRDSALSDQGLRANVPSRA